MYYILSLAFIDHISFSTHTFTLTILSLSPSLSLSLTSKHTPKTCQGQQQQLKLFAYNQTGQTIINPLYNAQFIYRYIFGIQNQPSSRTIACEIKNCALHD